MTEVLRRPEKSAEKLRRLAWPIFSQYPHIRVSLDWLRTNPQEFSERIESFNAALAKMSELLGNPTAIPEEYIHLRRFSELFKGDAVPRLEDAFVDTAKNRSVSKRALEYARDNYPEWADDDYESKATPAMGMFLMGYGLYLGLLEKGEDDIGGIEQLGRAFDHGLEEVLVMNFPRSLILKDVGRWMKEEKGEFHPAIIERLNWIL